MMGSALDGLPLAVATAPGWVEVAVAGLDELLVDHAHCELKAAASAVSLAGRFPERPGLVRELTALAREELRHFERVHALLGRRRIPLTRPMRDRYVRRLQAAVKEERLEPRAPARSGSAVHLLDQLLVSGFIEARSCERFRLLAGAPALDPGLRAVYAELAAAEARHHELFFAQAAEAAGATEAAARTRALADLEAEVVRALPPAPRMH